MDGLDLVFEVVELLDKCELALLEDLGHESLVAEIRDMREQLTGIREVAV